MTETTTPAAVPADITFADFDVHPEIVASLADAGILNPFPIQAMTLPVASWVTPGMVAAPRSRGPIPDRNSRSPTRRACGYGPTGSAARSLRIVSSLT